MNKDTEQEVLKYVMDIGQQGYEDKDMSLFIEQTQNYIFSEYQSKAYRDEIDYSFSCVASDKSFSLIGKHNDQIHFGGKAKNINRQLSYKNFNWFNKLKKQYIVFQDNIWNVPLKMANIPQVAISPDSSHVWYHISPNTVRIDALYLLIVAAPDEFKKILFSNTNSEKINLDEYIFLNTLLHNTKALYLQKSAQQKLQKFPQIKALYRIYNGKKTGLQKLILKIERRYDK